MVYHVLSGLAVGLGGTAFAFHSGGVAACAGCHAMHNTPNVAATGGAPGSPTGGPHLLTGSDQSSTCLNCHASNATTPSSYHVMTYPFAGGTNVSSIPVNRTPGGDFSWLLLSLNYSSQGVATYNPGSGHGHNIVAVDYGLTADPTYTTAPGGTFPSASLYCNSCHDPHNKLRRDSTGAIQSMVSAADPSDHRLGLLPQLGSRGDRGNDRGDGPRPRTRQWASTGSLRDILLTRLPARRSHTRGRPWRSPPQPITRRSLPTRSGSPTVLGPAPTRSPGAPGAVRATRP